MSSTALMPLTKKCVVCGDVAVGFNYSALSCKSCKVFFYRYESKKFKCLKENNCKIDPTTRSQCKKCRLDKCYAIGMVKMDLKPEITLPPKVSSLRAILEFNNKSSSDEIENFEFSKEITKFQKVKHSPFVLSGYEFDQITRVQSAIEYAFENERNLYFNKEVSGFKAMTEMHYPDMYARSIVNFCKNMTAFRMLNPDDQLMVLRQFVVNILSIWNAFLWDSEKSGYLMIEESGKQSVMVRVLIEEAAQKHSCGSVNMCKENLNFLGDLNTEMENDLIIRDLLIAQLLFYPRENVSCIEFIKYQYYLYSHLLRRYLMQKYRNTQKANRKFNVLMEMLGKLSRIKDINRVLTYEVCVDQLPELFKEIY